MEMTCKHAARAPYRLNSTSLPAAGPRTGSSHTKGFSLLELLVALALVGILATLAWPGYRDSLTRARRSDGINAMLAVQLAQETFRGNCAFYAQALGGESACGSAAATSVVKVPAVHSAQHSESHSDSYSDSYSESYYELSIQSGSASATAYTIVATPVGTQADDRACAPLTLSVDAANPQGVRAPADCW